MGIFPSTSSSKSVLERPSVVEIGGDESMARKSRIFKKSITDDYNFSTKVAGTGFSGPVRLATHVQTGKVYAVKRYDKNAADVERIEYLKSEAEVYLRLDHPNICKLFAIYEDDRNVWIVMEYCAGQELYQRLHDRKVYSESDAAEVTRQMVEAIHYLHSHHIVHRDLKLENWLYEKSDEDDVGRLKLIDFGFSKLWHPTRSKKMEASCGSLTYVSPDTLSGAYTNACDMWSLGVTVYFLLVGVPPFFGTEKIIIDRILRGAYSMNGPRWARVSEEGKSFVQKLLVVDPNIRMTSREALDHPWIANIYKEMNLTLDLSILHSLRQFALASQMKRAALTMMAYTLTTKDIEELTTLFKRFDRNLDGCLSLSDFMEVMRENFNISNQEIENLFNAMTSIKTEDVPNSEVCYSDFVAALLQTRLRFHEDTIREVFLKFDIDRSGYITADDLRQVIGNSFDGVDIGEIVRCADTNKDGRIDYEEFLAAVFAEAQSLDVPLTDMKKDELTSASKEDSLEKRRENVLKKLLGVVDSHIAGREAVTGPSLRMMTFSKSLPHLLKGVVGDYLCDPRSPHARPWDFRLEFEPFELTNFTVENVQRVKNGMFDELQNGVHHLSTDKKTEKITPMKSTQLENSLDNNNEMKKRDSLLQITNKIIEHKQRYHHTVIRDREKFGEFDQNSKAVLHRGFSDPTYQRRRLINSNLLNVEFSLASIMKNSDWDKWDSPIAPQFENRHFLSSDVSKHSKSSSNHSDLDLSHFPNQTNYELFNFDLIV